MTSELEEDGSLAPPAMLTVAAVARRLGVAPSTLRTWDRRYGLGPSAHTAGSHRRYSPSDVSRLVVMRGLVMEGVPPAEAAQIALGTATDALDGAGRGAGRGAGGDDGGRSGAGASPIPSSASASAASTPGSAPRPSSGSPWGAGTPTRGAAASATFLVAPASRRSPWGSHSSGDGSWSALGTAPTSRPATGPVTGPATGMAPTGVPTSRGPLRERPSVPVEESRSTGAAPEGAGRALWPVSPLAARHLLAAIDASPSASSASGSGIGSASSLASVTDPLPDLTDVDSEAVAQAVSDAGLASVIDRALRPDGRSSGGTGNVDSGMTGRAGGGRVVSLPDASPRARGLARAAMSLDTQELSRLLRDAVGSFGVIGAWDSMVLPVLKGLGDRWEATGEGVDVEHAFVEATVGVLRAVTSTLYRARNVRPVLLACADGDHHSLPLHVLAAALSEIEIGCRMLGVGLPPAALLAAVRRTGPVAVLVYAQLPIDDASPLHAFGRQRPAPRVLVGGPGWARADLPPNVSRVQSLRAAVDEVRTAVQL